MQGRAALEVVDGGLGLSIIFQHFDYLCVLCLCASWWCMRVGGGGERERERGGLTVCMGARTRDFPERVARKKVQNGTPS